MKISIRFGKLGVASISALLLMAGPAGAQSTTSDTDRSAGPTNPYCYTHTLPEEQIVRGIVNEVLCFDTAESRDVALVARYGPSTLLEAAPQHAVGSAAFSTRILARHYDSVGAAGANMSVVGTACNNGGINVSSYWIPRISSVMHGACSTVRHYQLPNFGGPVHTTTGPCYTQRTMPTNFDGNIRSIRYDGTFNSGCSI